MNNLEKLKPLATSYMTTMSAHKAAPKNFAALEAWDDATSKFSDAIRGNEENLIATLLAHIDTQAARIAELELVNDLFLRSKALMYQSGGTPIENSLNPIDAWLYDAECASKAMIECWSCHRILPRDSFLKADGYCPCCHGQVDFEEDNDDD